MIFSLWHLQIHTSRMTLADDVNLEEFVMTKDEFSGADINAMYRGRIACLEKAPHEGETNYQFCTLLIWILE